MKIATLLVIWPFLQIPLAYGTQQSQKQSCHIRGFNASNFIGLSPLQRCKKLERLKELRKKERARSKKVLNTIKTTRVKIVEDRTEEETKLREANEVIQDLVLADASKEGIKKREQAYKRELKRAKRSQTALNQRETQRLKRRQQEFKSKRTQNLSKARGKHKDYSSYNAQFQYPDRR